MQQITHTSARFPLSRDLTSGLRNDSSEADEQRESHLLRNFSCRLKAAQRATSGAEGLASRPKPNSNFAILFFERFGATCNLANIGSAETSKPPKFRIESSVSHQDS